MKKSWCFIVLAMPFFLCFDSTASFQVRTYYVSLVEKGTVNKFYNRLTNGTNHLVVTSQKPDNAIESYKFTLNSDQELLIVEPKDRKPDAITGVVETIGGFALTVLPNWGKLKHFHVDEQFSFVEMAKRVEQDHILVKQISLFGSSPERVLPNRFPSIPKSDPEELKSLLSQFSGAKEFVFDNEEVKIEERGSEEGRDLARTWLSEQYTNLGFEVRLEEYKTGINFIAEREGRDPSKVLLVTAHLDSVRNAGADDNGAGTISALAVAQALQGLDLRYNLRIVGFDQEEIGLVGSAAYAKSLNESGGFEGMIGVINMEMTAYDEDADKAFHIIDCEENTSSELTDTMMKAMKAISSPLQKVEACTNRSDHASFWRYDQPAIVISQNFFGGDSNPCYHRSCDKVDKLDFTYMSEVTDVVAATVAAYLVEQ